MHCAYQHIQQPHTTSPSYTPHRTHTHLLYTPSFKENSFEQLCINLANERLQQQFNGHVFKGEQEEYEREGIDWSYVDFVDNQDCLDLLEGLRTNQSMGVFPLIDEACRMPRATHEVGVWVVGGGVLKGWACFRGWSLQCWGG